MKRAPSQDAVRTLLATGPQSTAQIAEHLGVTIHRATGLAATMGLVPVHAPRRGVPTLWRLPTAEDDDSADDRAQLEAIDEWLNAVGIPEVGTTLERVVYALGRAR